MNQSIQSTLVDAARRNDVYCLRETVKGLNNELQYLRTANSSISRPEAFSLSIPLDGMALLHIAAFYDSLDVVIELVNRGVSVEGLSTHGLNALHYAALGGATESLAWLVTCLPKDWLSSAANGWTPVLCAVTAGYADALRLLVEAGGALDVDGCEPARQRALRMMHAECLSYLLRVGQSGDYSDVMLAITSYFPAGVPILVENGSNVMFVAADGETPLSKAVWMNEVEAVRFLLSHGADPRWVGNTGETLVHRAVTVGSLKILRMLLRAGASPEIRDGFGRSPLWCVGKGGKRADSPMQLAQPLLSRGLSLNDVDREGTPLLAALLPSHDRTLPIIELAIRSGVDLSQRVPKTGTTLRQALYIVLRPEERAQIDAVLAELQQRSLSASRS